MAGKYFEELQLGQTYRHQPGRTITEFLRREFVAASAASR